jgi:hypothetical protein
MRLLAVRIPKYRGDLRRPAQHLSLRQSSTAACLLVLFQRFPFDIVHDQIVTGVLRERLIDPRQIRVSQPL